jgi:hypothetical protein
MKGNDDIHRRLTRGRASFKHGGDVKLLMVNFHQPSHEFIFGVGMNFISYPLVLTPWYNKFIRACQFWSLMFMQDVSVESMTSG